MTPADPNLPFVRGHSRRQSRKENVLVESLPTPSRGHSRRSSRKENVPVELSTSTSGLSGRHSRQDSLKENVPLPVPDSIMVDLTAVSSLLESFERAADGQLQCIVCDRMFSFSSVQREQFSRLGWSDPKRCKQCRLRKTPSIETGSELRCVLCRAGVHLLSSDGALTPAILLRADGFVEETTAVRFAQRKELGGHLFFSTDCVERERAFRASSGLRSENINRFVDGSRLLSQLVRGNDGASDCFYASDDESIDDLEAPDDGTSSVSGSSSSLCDSNSSGSFLSLGSIGSWADEEPLSQLPALSSASAADTSRRKLFRCVFCEKRLKWFNGHRVPTKAHCLRDDGSFERHDVVWFAMHPELLGEIFCTNGCARKEMEKRSRGERSENGNLNVDLDYLVAELDLLELRHVARPASTALAWRHSKCGVLSDAVS